MENKPKFNRELFTTIVLQKFSIDYARSGKVEDAYNKLLSINKNNIEGRKILENCKTLFENSSTKKEVDLEIETIRNDTNATKGRNPTDSEIAKWLIKCFSEEIFAVNKRTYDMSQLPAKGFLAPIKTSQGKSSEVVSYVSFEQMQQEREKKDGKIIERPVISFKDKQGNTLLIELMGHLTYGSPNGNGSIRKYLITKNLNGIEQKYKVFTKIDIPRLRSDEAYRKVVIHELLSQKNLNRSNADGYIGEILTESILNPRGEKLESSIYTYQITSEHALVYDGEKLEAVRTYRQQEIAKETAEQSKTSISGDEPEL